MGDNSLDTPSIVVYRHILSTQTNRGPTFLGTSRAGQLDLYYGDFEESAEYDDVD
jgi:hypothetical protein